MGKQYIDQVYEQPAKNRSWEKSPKCCHKRNLKAISIIWQSLDK
tara:strand:+ start:2337 stop:2468 length:132 start_codon:yes stop_codon:yes gene_type:complete